ncbi:class D beta-lactamase [Hymenobacter persicinus]|uniref:Class D beta-lactamase n=1 Tax=Hymenobacter persicinus TaxID=2025506 RepID=A0A4Q5LCT0_9BACT|nr:class D beta-lactamase [Hymenobacter persicinus]RYU79150.1 class D beta-lactamase [Hymenobacter persicinus]
MRLVLFFGLLLAQTGALAQALTERNFQKHFDDYGVRGSFLLFDQSANRFTAYNVARCNEGFLPGATFQIPAVLIGLDTGVLKDTTQLLHYDGTPPADPQFSKDVTVGWAIRQKCEPCFQQLSRDIGVKRYQQKLMGLKFGSMVVMPESLDSFWQAGMSRVSQFQQVAFLRRLYNQQLPLTPQSQAQTKRLFRLQSRPGWTLYGKLGKTRRGKMSNGWFVGWLEQAGSVYFFALNIEPKDGKDANEQFLKGRREITEHLLQELSLMPN